MIDFDVLRQEQLRLQKHLNCPCLREEEIHQIAGMDVQHGEKNGFAAYQIFDYQTGEILEEDVFMLPEMFPYQPGFLYYREKAFMEAVLGQMKQRPDLIACDGNGVLHPRKMGEAVQFGIVNDIPTIGIAKHKMEFEGLQETDDKFWLEGESIGQKVWLSERSKIPMIVSAGYRTDLTLAVHITEHMQQFSQESKYSYLTKGSDHLARMAQREWAAG